MTRGLFNPCLFRAVTGTRALCLLALLLAARCPGYPREAICFPLVASLMANYRLNRHLLLRAGLSYNHISNGGAR